MDGLIDYRSLCLMEKVYIVLGLSMENVFFHISIWYFFYNIYKWQNVQLLNFFLFYHIKHNAYCIPYFHWV